MKSSALIPEEEISDEERLKNLDKRIAERYPSKSHLKLTKFSIAEAYSFPGAYDIVFYKEEKNGLYRLRYVDQIFRDPSPVMALHRAMCVSKYAPEIIDGEVITENSDEVHVKVENDIYVLQKNAEKLKFWYVTDNLSDKKDTSALREINNKEMQDHNQLLKERLIKIDEDRKDHINHIKRLDEILKLIEKRKQAHTFKAENK